MVLYKDAQSGSMLEAGDFKSLNLKLKSLAFPGIFLQIKLQAYMYVKPQGSMNIFNTHYMYMYLVLFLLNCVWYSCLHVHVACHSLEPTNVQAYYYVSNLSLDTFLAKSGGLCKMVHVLVCAKCSVVVVGYWQVCRPAVLSLVYTEHFFQCFVCAYSSMCYWYWM